MAGDSLNIDPKWWGLEPLPKEEWKKFTGKMQWDCVVALRGPDYCLGDNLKWWTSSVIRYRMSNILRVGGMIHPGPRFILVPDSTVFGQLGAFDMGHFRQHQLEAACILDIAVFMVGAKSVEWLLKNCPSDTLPTELLKKLAPPKEASNAFISK